MDSFTNETIDLEALPKFESIRLYKPHPNYWKVIRIHLSIFLLILGICCLLLFKSVKELENQALLITSAYIFIAIVLFLILKLSFKKRGYAVRTHDVIYKSGIITETTTIIPLNRIQHIELNEGIFSRIYKLGKLQIFTAGGQTGHMHIAGIPIDEAKSIRDVLLKKIDLLDQHIR